MKNKADCIARYGNPEYHEWLPYLTTVFAESVYKDAGSGVYRHHPTGAKLHEVRKVYCRWCLEIRDFPKQGGSDAE